MVKMKNICCIVCDKCRKFKNPKISYIFAKPLVFSIVYTKCGNQDEKIYKGEESIEILNSWFNY